MKTDAKSNFGPLSRAFAALPFVAVVGTLCLMPVTGSAQIFVANEGNDTIGKYDATTGATINSSFISSGLSFPTNLALFGGKLFVTNLNNTIGVYDATTGATINSSFISSGLSEPIGIAISGGKLFVSNLGNNTIGVYDSTTGAMINSRFISGLNAPAGIAAFGGNLFVANDLGHTIGKYNATTGTTIDHSFISGLDFPEGLTISRGNLFVTNPNTNDSTVGKYDATTGATINSSLVSFPELNSHPAGIAVSGEKLFVPHVDGTMIDTIGEYNATTGAVVNSSFISGLNVPTGIVIASPSSVPDRSSTLTLLLLGIAGNFGFNLLLHRQDTEQLSQSLRL